MYRSRKAKKRYHQKAPEVTGCPFCDLSKRHVVRVTKHAAITESDFPYELWDGRPVKQHLLLVPKRHVGKASELSKAERQEIGELAFEYESNGYDVYARGLGSTGKTVPGHQHTHLIATEDSYPNVIIRIGKPYWMFWR